MQAFSPSTWAPAQSSLSSLTHSSPSIYTPGRSREIFRESKSHHAVHCFNTPLTSHCTHNKTPTLSCPIRPPEMQSPVMSAPALSTLASSLFQARSPSTVHSAWKPQTLTARAHSHSGQAPISLLRQALFPIYPIKQPLTFWTRPSYRFVFPHSSDHFLKISYICWCTCLSMVSPAGFIKPTRDACFMCCCIPHAWERV